MARMTWIGALAMIASAASAQVPTAGRPPATKADSIARADSVAKAAADSVALVRKFEAMQSANAQVPPTPAAPTGGAAGPTNPRMLPDFSAVGDLVGDFTGERSTQGDGSRLGVREVELAVQSVVDPYFRGEIFLGFSDTEKVSIEQAFVTTTALPYGLQAQVGRFLMPFGKEYTTHRHDLHTVEYPFVIQRFLSDDGLKGTGATLSKIVSPFGFYQELIVSVINRFGERPDSLTAATAANKSLEGMGLAARWRNYVDFDESANLELSASAITGLREQPLSSASAGVNAVNVRQSVVGLDLTYRWKPLQQGLYSSFILQGEVMRQVNGVPEASAVPVGVTYLGPSRDFTGGYLFARWQLSQRLYLGGRYDHLEDPLAAGATLRAASLVLEWFPSEFSKLEAQWERTAQPGMGTLNRLLLQATFAIGPHKPHPF